ncbi:hypothetical protein M8C21_015664 [Ambrosia artemisiifolia]|uniref:DUF4408 domain-containing protein n=1 Tax=Ambrosia artemisiifolia TaxID=4212 RepID=A0AAD5CBK4_AMBAR|nr:hypothetical protein M8C21_015664 [Ambrosia artemisiifolia]
MPSSSSYIHSLKLVLILTTIISIAITIKLTVPLLSTSLPVIWSVIITWLKPPYLYVVINAIIITIAATTRFQHNHHHDTQSQPPPSDLTPVSNNNNNPSFGVMELPSVSYGGEPVVCETGPALETVPVRVNEDEIVNSGLGKKVEPEFGNLPVKEKQPVTSRFANTRKPVKASLEGARALRVLKPKKHETLETTWKMITEGRQLPLTRHLKKSDTFNNLHDNKPTENPTTTTNTKVVKKSETFKDRTSTTTTYANQNHYPSTNSSPTKTKLKKDGSLSQDELNRRVEAFIKKFNDDMRLQRQESLKQYMEMVNSGAR